MLRHGNVVPLRVSAWTLRFERDVGNESAQAVLKIVQPRRLYPRIRTKVRHLHDRHHLARVSRAAQPGCGNGGAAATGAVSDDRFSGALGRADAKDTAERVGF